MWTENAKMILSERYSLKDKNGNSIEVPELIVERIASNLANSEQEHNQFVYVLENKLFLPNTPAWINVGNPRKGTASACFTFEVEDDIENIFHVMGTKAAVITKQGGGVGFNLSKIRPRGDLVRSSGKIASGVVSWMRIANTMADVVSQGGVRRGAIMCLLDVSHPDIFEFIESKTKNETDFKNMNISVAITDNFMEAVKKNEMWDLINPRNGEVWNSISAVYLFNKISKCAAKYGEPGIVFIDRINQFNPTPHLGRMTAVNPCAEYPGYDNESCTLGSINLYAHLDKREFGFDYLELEKTVRIAVRMLDRVIEKNVYAFDEIKEATLKTRKIGIGVMGWATSLIAMRIRYGSPKSIQLAEEVMSFINGIAADESHKIALERGAYPASKDGEFAHATRTTIAPTGTISIVANVSGGIEPLFSFVVRRKILGGKTIDVYDPAFLKICEQYNIPQEEIDKACSFGSLRGTKFPDFLKDFVVTINDLKPDDHLYTQQAFQKYTDNAVSKTINLPAGSTVDNVKEVYIKAFDLGLKGLTVYIDGSRTEQVLNRPTTDHCPNGRCIV
ncbi:MAG: adenosylcobalamin-dependent ribonucleoside-diphosphate reductase [Candidatus Nanoarchaeia archaeon]